MSSLRDRLDRKGPRKITIPILVDDHVAAAAVLQAATVAADAAAFNPAVDEVERERLEHERDLAEQAYRDCWAEVEFRGHPAEVEALVVEHTLEDAGDGEPGVDRAAVLPKLAALCAVDIELQDEAWWADQLASDAWTDAERDHLWAMLFAHLHYSLPSPVLGKG